MPPRSGVPSAATRRQLVAAAGALFAERGYARTSLEEIAKAAGLTRGAVHWHFASKKEVLIEVLEEQLDDAISSKDALLTRAGTAVAFNQMQRDRSTARQPKAVRGRALLMMEFWLEAARDPELAKAARGIKSRLREATARQVEALADAAQVELPLPSRTLGSALMALDDGFTLQQLLDPTIDNGDLWDVVELMTRLILGAKPSPRT